MTVYEARPGYLLKRAEHALRQAMDRELGGLGLTTPQYAALSALERQPGMSNAELARRGFVTPQTMHRVTTLLEERGLVERDDERGRGRRQALRVSRSGAATLTEAHRRVEVIEERMVAGIGHRDLATTIRTLGRAIDNVDA